METGRVKRIVIIGGGVIGCSAAYFLTRHPQYNPEQHSIILLEATKVAGGSSGKAGGCLATWATPTCLASLSFKLHGDLAAEHNGQRRWGYRNIYCAQCEVNDESANTTSSSKTTSNEPVTPPELNWIAAGRIRSYIEEGNPDNSAQVHPYLFTTSLANLAESKGVRVVLGSATRINYSEGEKAIKSISYKAKGSAHIEELQATHVVLAAGPWTPNLLPSAPISGSRSHSIVINVPSQELSPHVLFFGEPKHTSVVPKLEIYPRPDDTAYVCGPTDFRKTLPPTSDMVEADPESCQIIRAAASSLSQQLADGVVIREQACYRPVVKVPGRARSTGPILGETGVAGLMLASGHDEWGIQNSPATGKIVSELIFDGKALSADITTLDPRMVLQ